MRVLTSLPIQPCKTAVIELSKEEKAEEPIEERKSSKELDDVLAAAGLEQAPAGAARAKDDDAMSTNSSAYAMAM